MEKENPAFFSEKGAKKLIDKSSIREVLHLAEQAAEPGFKIVPGKRWAVHYKNNGIDRLNGLNKLLQGQYLPEEIIDDLKPDALVYNIEDLKSQGIAKVNAKVRDITDRLKFYDHLGFAEFVSKFQRKNVDLGTIQSVYEGISQSRIQKQRIDSYLRTGQEQMKLAIKQEVQAITNQFDNLGPLGKVLGALKTTWTQQDLGITRSEAVEELLEKLSPQEKELFNQLKDPYRIYTQSGDKKAYHDLSEIVQENIVVNPKKTQEEINIEEEKLKEELEPYIDQVGPPGSSEDPAIPPEDKDEYHTPPPGEQGEAGEKQKSRPFFTIEPSGISTKPLTGSYCSGRKSYYDFERKTWSKKKQLSEYHNSLSDEKRQTISGTVGRGITSIPLPNSYALDSTSLKYSGHQPKIKRDQNGCFYLESDGPCTFKIDFAKEPQTFIGPPVGEDLQSLCQGQLSQETEKVIASLGMINDPIRKAMGALKYLRSKHFYPGGGDLKLAQALQYKLRSESTADNYLQNLDQSEYLECYSANTLYLALLRRLGIPSRLIVGHRVQGAKEGKAVIDETTGHGWSEIWDGNNWIGMDATPPPKSEDKKEEEKDQSESTPSEEADDGGIKPPSTPEEQKGQDRQDGQDGQQQDTQGESNQDATDQEIQKGEQELQQSQETLEQMEKKSQELSQKIQDTESFKDLKKLQDQLSQEELLDEMKKEIEKKLEAKEEQMKDEIKEKLEKMADDGFIDEEKKEEWEKKLDQDKLEQLDQLAKQITQENRLYDEYEDIKEEVMSYVEEWFRYFAEKLPKKEEVDIDEDSLSRQGAFNKKAVMKYRNLVFGTVKNPRIIKSSVEPRFIASIILDVSGSMAGVKLLNARKLLVFYNELFSRIEEEFGYIRSSIDIFSDSVEEVKTYDQDYDSPKRYEFSDGSQSTVKVRLMKSISVKGGTNMLTAIQKAAGELNEQVRNYPDHASALYFIGDGGDTCGNSSRIREFLKTNDEEVGFGEHMLSAIMLGDESQKQELSGIFGDEHTTVAGDFDTLIAESMTKFDEDIEEYLRGKIV